VAIAVAAMLNAGCEESGTSSGRIAGKVTINGTTWQVELANTAEQRYQGLSDRKELPQGRGMLFVYPEPQQLTFCMRYCLIPLDIAFIDGQNRVVNMCTMETEPYGFETKSYLSSGPAQYALEVPKGALEAAGVKVGDKVEISSDIPSPAKAEPGP